MKNICRIGNTSYLRCRQHFVNCIWKQPFSHRIHFGDKVSVFQPEQGGKNVVERMIQVLSILPSIDLSTVDISAAVTALDLHA